MYVPFVFFLFSLYDKKKNVLFSILLLQFFAVSDPEKKNRKGNKDVQKKEEEMVKQWGLKWLKVLFVL